jgi:hypothetical protein
MNEEKVKWITNTQISKKENNGSSRVRKKAT